MRICLTRYKVPSYLLFAARLVLLFTIIHGQDILGARSARMDINCIATSHGCVFFNDSIFPHGLIMKQYRNVLPDQQNTLELLAHNRHVLLVGPETPLLALGL